MPSRPGKLAALLLASLAWLLASPASAAARSTSVVNDVYVSMRQAWTDGVDKGWQPIYVLLDNRSERPRRVRLVLNGGGGTARVERNVTLDGLQAVEVELLGPVWANANSAWNLHVACGGDRAYLSSGSWNPRSVALHTVLVTGAAVPATWSASRWTEALSTESTTAGMGYTAAGGATAATPANDNVRFAIATFDELPTHWDAYSCLDLVMLDARDGLPEPPRLEALAAWARSGGDLILFGPGAELEARANPTIAPWIEERFRITDEDFRLDGEKGVVGYSFGHGTLRIVDGEHAVDEEPLRHAVHAVVFASKGMVPDPHGWRLGASIPTLPGVGAVPYKVFTLLLIAFAVLIGPVNFLWIKRTKRPALLLATIPGIALTTAALFLIYGLFSQGVDVRAATRTLTVLDQRTHRASTAEVRAVFAGLAPGDLRPGAGTSCYVVPPRDPMGHHVAGSRAFGSWNPMRFRVEQSAELRLGGDFLPARRLVRHVLLTDRAARARLEWSWEGDRPRVANGFETSLKTVLARGADGRWFALDDSVPPGGTAVLRPLPAEDAAAAQAELWDVGAVHRDRPLYQGAYLARLAAGTFGDDCGVRTREVAANHVVLGILDGEAPFGR